MSYCISCTQSQITEKISLKENFPFAKKNNFFQISFLIIQLFASYKIDLFFLSVFMFDKKRLVKLIVFLKKFSLISFCYFKHFQQTNQNWIDLKILNLINIEANFFFVEKKPKLKLPKYCNNQSETYFLPQHFQNIFRWHQQSMAMIFFQVSSFNC